MLPHEPKPVRPVLPCQLLQLHAVQKGAHTAGLCSMCAEDQAIALVKKADNSLARQFQAAKTWEQAALVPGRLSLDTCGCICLVRTWRICRISCAALLSQLRSCMASPQHVAALVQDLTRSHLHEMRWQGANHTA